MEGNSSRGTTFLTPLLDKYTDNDVTSTGLPLQQSLTALYTGAATGPVF